MGEESQPIKVRIFNHFLIKALQMSGPSGGQDQVFSSEEEDLQCVELREKISTKSSQMQQIINDKVRFTATITDLANIGKSKIDLNEKQELKFALVYLREAEKMLEYAASSGKNLSKELIITILHNQASIYQKLWQLDNCSDYLEGIIFNYDNFIRETSAHGSTIDPTQSPDPTRLKMNQKLARYNLQYCAVNSQLLNHDASIQAVRKALALMTDCVCNNQQDFQRQLSKEWLSDIQIRFRLDLLFGLATYYRKFEQSLDLIEIHKKVLKATHYSLQMWNQNKKKREGTVSSDGQFLQYLNGYSIGNIVQIMPIQFDSEQVGFMSMRQRGSREFDRQFHPYNKIVLLSACFFSMATELRLKSIELYKKNLEERKFSRQYKLSINYHLLAIMIVAAYIPSNIKYLNQILLSYEKHYAVNLTDYKTVQIQSIIKMMDILGIQITSILASTRQQLEKTEKQEFQTKNDYNLKTNFEHKGKKLEKMRSLKRITKELNEPNKKYEEKEVKTPVNKSKESKTSFSISKHDKKDRTASKNDSFKKSPEYMKEKHIMGHKGIPKVKSKKGTDMLRSRQKQEKKSRPKQVVDQTEQLFFCFTKKTKKTQGVLGTPNSQVRSNSNGSSKSKNTKLNNMSPRNLKLKVNSPTVNKHIKSPPKRKNISDNYYF